MTVRKLARLASVAAGVLIGVNGLSASGPIGIFGLIEKVVFEPNEPGAERVQVWGSFAYVEGGTGRATAASVARGGYLYFRLDPQATPAQRDTVRTEWADLKAVAGTSQVVGFGNWGYIGGFGGLDPSVRSTTPPYILEMYPGRGEMTDLRVRPASESPASPAVYQTNAGVVKISDQGNHAAVVKALKAALAAR
jgi:hypothetical protein